MICRICLQIANDPLNIFEEELDIASVLQQHFWFEPLPNDGNSAFICYNCWAKIRDFHLFYVEVEKVHLDLLGLGFTPAEHGAVSQSPIEANFIKEELCETLWHEELDSEEQRQEQMQPVASGTVKNPLYEPEVNVSSIDVTDALAQNGFPTEQIKEEGKSCAGESSAEESCADESCADRSSAEESSNGAEVEAEATTATAAPSDGRRRKGRRRKAQVREERDTSSIDTPPKPKRKNRPIISARDNEIVKKHISMGCDLCTFVGQDFSEMSEHFRQKHPNTKPYVMCCDRKLNKRFLVVQHAYKHEDPEFFKCLECNKAYSDGYRLRSHMLANHPPEEELKFTCDQCPKRFSRRYLLDMHKPSHIPMHERKFLCKKCPHANAFASEHLLLIHVNMRHTKATNVCHVCAKEIRDNRSFEKHVRLHFEDSGPRVKCPMPNCDRWLKDEDNMKQHLRRHNVEGKIFTCDACGKVCKNRRSLTSHFNYAHTNAVFSCDECQKTFKKAITLREHMAQHTGESLYKCPFCSRTFNSNANMHSHKKKMHPVEWDIWRKTKRGSSQHVASNKMVMEVVASSFNTGASEAKSTVAKLTPADDRSP